MLGCQNSVIPADGSVTSIGSAFIGCSGLTSVTIPNSVRIVETSAFRACSGLTSIIVTDSLIGFRIFSFTGCNRLESVYFIGTEEKWNEISVGGNPELEDATTYYYVENAADVPQDGGNYWHYGTDGVTPVVWGAPSVTA